MSLLQQNLEKADDNSGSIEAAELTELAFQALDLIVDSPVLNITDQVRLFVFGKKCIILLCPLYTNI